MTAVASDVRRIALAGLIDSAAMFPPAATPLDVAVPQFRIALQGRAGGLYGRLLVPARDLPAAAARTDLPQSLGVVFATGATPDDVRATVQVARGLHVDSVELREPDDLELTLALLEPLAAVSLYVEVTPARIAKLAPRLAGLVTAGVTVGAKLRCGGPAATDFPDPADVARFLSDVRAAGLPTKVTQGLHHPFRTVDPLTGALQHGFVNLVAALALPGVDMTEVVAEADPAAFALDATTLRCRDAEAGAEHLRAARRVLVGLGSCSVDEPAHDLETAGLLW